ncbi:hypothetical protein IWX78_003033 [Mycetocola sp. CAN_C7]|uniref:biopolymer transporter Tol n=1 Tax=Mycetocola sp. CAN_C7 TaxID=2787724 RepID=UPI0018C91425
MTSDGSTDSDSNGSSTTDDDARWLVINGRRWRRTDPFLPADVVEQLTSHLGRGRSGVRSAKRAGDADAIAAARERVGFAKAGLGERGPYWWDERESDRLARALDALQALDALDSGDAERCPPE